MSSPHKNVILKNKGLNPSQNDSSYIDFLKKVHWFNHKNLFLKILFFKLVISVLEYLVKYMYFMVCARIQFLPKMTCYLITVSNDFGHCTGSVFKYNE